MKTMIPACGLAGLLLTGCGPAPQGREKSTGQEVIDTITQKNTLDAYKKARDTLDTVGAQKNKEYEEALRE